MKMIKLNTVDANPVHDLVIRVCRDVSRAEEDIDELLNVLHDCLTEEQERRKRINESEYCTELPYLVFVGAEQREDCAIEFLPEYGRSIWWAFSGESLSDEEKEELSFGMYLEPESYGYSKEQFRCVMKDAHDWEIDLLMEYEELVKDIRAGLEALDEGIATLSRACISVSSQKGVKLPQRSQSD